MIKQLTYLASITAILLCSSCMERSINKSTNSADEAMPSGQVGGTGEQLVWSDEFNYEGLPDSTKWSFNTGGHGWGNNERQFYTDKRKDNVQVQDGKLIIRAIKEEYKNSKFTSARLTTRNKGDWKYGRVEVKAKLPKGRGIWPAIWMMPSRSEYGSWPKSGEIDIMENVGYLPDSVYATVHTDSYNHVIGTQRTRGLLITDLSTAFHVYTLQWKENKISIAIDGEVYFNFDNNKTGSAAWPFDKEFFLILNIAVGGNWGGKKGVDESIFPQAMEIDYVRVYQ